MPNTTILATSLLALVGIVSALCINSASSAGQENFLGMSFPASYTVQREQRLPSGGFATVPGNFSAMLSPRFSNVDYGAAIKYNMPNKSMQAVPTNPLTYGNVAVSSKESFKPPSCGPSGANKGSVYGMSGLRNMPAANYAAPGRKAADQKLQTYEVTSMLPVGSMTELTSSGAVQQPVMYDRFMYSTGRSRLRGLADKIRGDLAIAPISGGWFVPSVNQNDIEPGALAVMGGIDNGTARQTMGLINAASGGTQTTLAGVNLGNQFDTELTQGGSTINVTAFP